ncbi:spermidine synthase [Gordonia jinhuaensis]|uniref:Spermidine synthase n=2 Tax=Gordonia jinhuaensis TaxID=1517702 RepID=A0A916WN82_9ACTN|nr:spermidine synthase [Gordonia jinhuaensis]
MHETGSVWGNSRLATMSPRPSSPHPPEGEQTIDTGTCEIVRDRDVPGWLLLVNGQPSSHLADDPHVLAFEYMRWMAAIIRAHSDGAPETAGTPRLRGLHLGGAGCALPRYLVAEYPGSHHRAVEVDAALAAGVRDWFDLPRAPGLRIRVDDARRAVDTAHPGAYDLVVRDVFAGDRTPDEFIGPRFAGQVHAALSPGGLYVVNCGPAAAGSVTSIRADAAGVAEVFAHVAVVAPMSVLRGRTRGNVIIAGSDRPIGGAALSAALLSDQSPAHLLSDDAARSFATPSRDRPGGTRSAEQSHAEARSAQGPAHRAR